MIICSEHLHPLTEKASIELFYSEYSSLSPPRATMSSLSPLRMLLATLGEIPSTPCLSSLRIPSCLFDVSLLLLLSLLFLVKNFVKWLYVLECPFLY